MTPEKAIERLAERHGLSQWLLSRVVSAFTVELASSMAGVINAFTRAGNDRQVKLEDRSRLQQVGGRVLALAEQGGRWL